MSFTASVWLAIGISAAVLIAYLAFDFYDANKRLDVVLDLSRAGQLTEPHDHELFGGDHTGGTK